jgi:hypothetical protein
VRPGARAHMLHYAGAPNGGRLPRQTTEESAAQATRRLWRARNGGARVCSILANPGRPFGRISTAPQTASARRPLHQHCDSEPSDSFAGLVIRS